MLATEIDGNGNTIEETETLPKQEWLDIELMQMPANNNAVSFNNVTQNIFSHYFSHSLHCQ